MVNKITQEQRVLEYLKVYGSITRAEAMSNLRIANLTAVISNLRLKKSVNIVTLKMHGQNEYGKYTYAQYVLGE